MKHYLGVDEAGFLQSVTTIKQDAINQLQQKNVNKVYEIERPLFIDRGISAVLYEQSDVPMWRGEMVCIIRRVHQRVDRIMTGWEFTIYLEAITTDWSKFWIKVIRLDNE